MDYELYSQNELESKSPLIVMESPAGFYIGKTYWDNDFGCYMAWSRNSIYFHKKEIAKDYLECISEEDMHFHRYANLPYEIVLQLTNDALKYKVEAEEFVPYN